MTLEASRIRERIAQAERDIAELAEEVARGDMDAETASRLRDRYEVERTRLLERLESGDIAEESREGSFFTARRIAGAAILIIAVAGLTLGVVKTVGGRSSAAEGVAADVVAGNGVDLADVTDEEMEAVIAQNPDIAPMRLALADRYFAEGDFSNALKHYMYVLQDLEVQDPGALANVGWMTYLSDEPDVALSYVERSLAIQPDGGIAFWYLANIRYYGLGDAAGAVVPLQKLLEYDNLPDELRTAAESLLAEVEAAG
jgi:tetratricopeptide (TPR) repeat protein